MISVSHTTKIIKANIKLPASKSISNRVLVIQFLMKKSFQIENLSECNDTVDLVKAIQKIEKIEPNLNHQSTAIDVGEAGTSYRFLTALLSILPGNYELCGSEQLMKRPILPLVSALNELGAEILTNNGTGPLTIKGKQINGGYVAIDANISSQFITALMLVAPYFNEGLTLELKGKIVSMSYIKMTVTLMRRFGAQVDIEDQIIRIKQGGYQSSIDTFKVESDWTAASYWYAFAALSTECNLELDGLENESLQGDSIASDLFVLYGVKSYFEQNKVMIAKMNNSGFINIFDFIDQPDLVQTFVFLNTSLGLSLQVNNAANLMLKETNRIEAISEEIQRIGAKLVIQSGDDFYVENQSPKLKPNSIFKTYKDHRMAMSAAILAMKFSDIQIAEEQVVAKSYPKFWEDLKLAGFEIKKL
jgi:3-phosphoshikimate 1-carboxyvinyltransferase